MFVKKSLAATTAALAGALTVVAAAPAPAANSMPFVSYEPGIFATGIRIGEENGNRASDTWRVAVINYATDDSIVSEEWGPKAEAGIRFYAQEIAEKTQGRITVTFDIYEAGEWNGPGDAVPGEYDITAYRYPTSEERQQAKEEPYLGLANSDGWIEFPVKIDGPQNGWGPSPNLWAHEMAHQFTFCVEAFGEPRKRVQDGLHAVHGNEDVLKAWYVHYLIKILGVENVIEVHQQCQGARP